MKKLALLILIYLSTVHLCHSQSASDGDVLFEGGGFVIPGSPPFGGSVYLRSGGAWVAQPVFPASVSGSLWVEDGSMALFGPLTVSGDLYLQNNAVLSNSQLTLSGSLNNFTGQIGPTSSPTASYTDTGISAAQITSTIIISGSSRAITTSGRWAGNQNDYNLTFSGNAAAEFTLGTDIAAKVISFTTNNTLTAGDNRILAEELNISNSSTVSSSKSGSGSSNQVLLPSGAVNTTLDIDAGSTFTFLGSAPEVDINTFNDNGTLSYGGTGTQSFVSNAGTAVLSSLENLSISGGGTLQLDEDKIIEGILSMNGNIDLNDFNLQLGTSTTVRGTLTYTSGIIFNRSANSRRFRRYFNTDALGDEDDRGRFPMGTRIGGTNWRRNLFFTGTPTNAGYVDVAYDQEDLVNEGDVVSVADGAATIIRRSRAIWCITTSVAMNSMSLDIEGQGLVVTDVSHLRCMLNSSVTGTHRAGTGTTSRPRARRTGISFTAFTQLCFYIGSTNTGSNLPVTLVSFTGKSNGSSVDLQWRTADEFENDRFEIERSIRGIGNFERINTIRGNGTTSIAHNYLYTDAEIPAKKGDLLYYRLKQIDRNGTFEYSPIISVKLDDSNQIPQSWKLNNTLYTGVTELELIDWELNKEDMYSFVLMSANGKELFRKHTTINDLNDELNSSLAKASSNIYILYVRSFKGIEQFKILKL